MIRPNLFYHYRSLRYGKRLWGSHQVKVASFLNDWNPKGDELLLFGPSGGYSLPEAFIRKFSKIIAVEPDPVARLVFEKRFQVKPEWVKQPVQFNHRDDLARFAPFTGPVLFCNVLGQIPMKNTSSFRRVLHPFLEGRSFASYHDAMSGHDIEFDCEDAPRKKTGLTQMKSWIYVKNPSGKFEVTAHLAPDLFDEARGLEYRYWWWKITDRQSHLLEGVFKNV